MDKEENREALYPPLNFSIILRVIGYMEKHIEDCKMQRSNLTQPTFLNQTRGNNGELLSYACNDMLMYNSILLILFTKSSFYKFPYFFLYIHGSI